MFRKINLVMTAALAGLAAAVPALSAPPFVPNWREPVGFIQERAYVSAPPGFLAFCERHPEDCTPSGQTGPLDLTAERMTQLNDINAIVNATIFFNSDLGDTWDYPQDNIGDCEDFVIEKRKRLMQLGWPENALLITIVRRRVPDFAGRTSHAVLTVRTAQGDYILDNEIGPAVPWTTAGRIFEYVMIQTQFNPRLWALVEPQVDSRTQLP